MEVKDFEEFQQWINGNSEGTISIKKTVLKRFSEYHAQSPRELILEAREKPEGENKHLEKNIAGKKLLEFYNHVTDNEDISESTARMYWRYIKGFYRFFGVNLKQKIPKGKDRVNEQPEYRSADVKKMLDACYNPRDRAIILCAYQGGMNTGEICRLNYGHVKHGLENNEVPLCIHKTRKKTGITHETWLRRDAVEALKTYLSDRRRKLREKKKEQGIENPSVEIEEDEPLFAKQFTISGTERMKTAHVQRLMRDIYDRVGEEIDEAQRIDSDINPLSLKYLRKAFGIACDENNVGRKFKEYWMGHRAPYNGAYSGGLSRELQKEEHQKLETALSVTSPSERIEAKIEQKLDTHKEMLLEMQEKNQNLEEMMKRMAAAFNKVLKDKEMSEGARKAVIDFVLMEGKQDADEVKEFREEMKEIDLEK